MGGLQSQSNAGWGVKESGSSPAGNQTLILCSSTLYLVIILTAISQPPQYFLQFMRKSSSTNYISITHILQLICESD